jgi:threonine/homoserine efflux transporter RhtA
MKNKKGFEIPAAPAVLLAIISFQCGAALAKGIFPVLGAVGKNIQYINEFGASRSSAVWSRFPA